MYTVWDLNTVSNNNCQNNYYYRTTSYAKQSDDTL